MLMVASKSFGGLTPQCAGKLILRLVYCRSSGKKSSHINYLFACFLKNLQDFSDEFLRYLQGKEKEMIRAGNCV